MKVVLNSFRGMRERGLTLALLVGVLVTVASEFLPLTSGAARLFWGATALFLMKQWRGCRPPRPGRVVGLILVLGAMTFVTALLAPPNTCDSLAYHMTRVAQWIQNGSLAYYPVSEERQIYLQPWAEFAILQLSLLSGGDRLVNLVQWGAALGCCAGVSAIARELAECAFPNSGEAPPGIPPANDPECPLPHPGRAQGYAAALCASLPMLLLQASSTQNDLVESFWMVCLVYFCLRLRAVFCWRYWLLAALACGLAWLTKGTGYIYSSPFLAVLFWKWRSPRRILPFLGLAVLLNLGFFARNIQACGLPMAIHSPAVSDTRNEGLTALLWVLNLGRNLAVHLPVAEGTGLIDRGARWAHRMVGVNPDDPRFTYPYARFHPGGWRRHEDVIGNWLTLLLLPGCFLLRRHRTYGAQLVVAFLLLGAGLRWQPWIARLQLPIWVLLTPLLGEWLALPRRRPWPQAILLVHILWGFFCLLFNENRPWIDERVTRTTGERWNIFTRSREQQYYSCLPDSEEQVYRHVWPVIRSYHPAVVGLLGNRLDYLFFVFAREDESSIKFLYGDKQAPLVVRDWPDEGGDLPGYRSLWKEGNMEVYERL